jgi:hypothetical protein
LVELVESCSMVLEQLGMKKAKRKRRAMALWDTAGVEQLKQLQ